jgi:glycosyltransferase involved in cell wall biosynthesis
MPPAPTDASTSLVSIVTPTLDAVPWLERMLESVAAQRVARIEHVVIDGGSTDGTLDLLDRHRDRLAHVESGADRGMYDALDRGFRRTTGEILCWLNADDEWLPGTLRTVTRLFREFPDVEWITTGCPAAIDADGGITWCGRIAGFSPRGFRRGDNLPGRGWAADGFLQQESTFWRRSLWERAGGRMDTSLRLAGDFELWSRFMHHATPWCVEAPLGLFRYRPGQLSAERREAYLAEAEAVFRRDGGRPPWRAMAALRVGFHRHAPLRLKRLAALLGVHEPRAHLAHVAERNRWVQVWQ